jgi:hypothetical protein
VFGLLMSWTVLRTGAIGWHFGGNLVSVVLQFTVALEAPGPAWLVGIPPSVGGGGLLAPLATALQAAGLAVLLRLLTAPRRREWQECPGS